MAKITFGKIQKDYSDRWIDVFLDDNKIGRLIRRAPNQERSRVGFIASLESPYWFADYFVKQAAGQNFGRAQTATELKKAVRAAFDGV